MPGFSSIDNLVASITAGQAKRTDWNKNFLPTTAAVAGEWFNLMRGGGNPGADTAANAGTNLAFQQMFDSTAAASGILHGGNVAPAYKSILGASAYSAAATTMPAVLMLVDLLGFYRVTSTTTITAQATTNPLVAITNFTTDGVSNILTHTGYNLKNLTRVQVSTTTTLPTGLSAATDYFVIRLTDTTCKLATSYANAVAGTAITISSTGTGTHTASCVLPRYTDGAGVQAIMWANNATPLGAATPNLSLSSYTNSKQVAAQTTPATLPAGKTAAANGLILYSGTGAGKYGPFMPLANGDAGIRQVDGVQISSSYVSGEFSVGLVVPLLTLPMTTLGVAAERDLVNQMPSLPRVYDGACLQWLLYNGAATPINSAFYGHLDFGWN
jgi:hypothetical protein